MIKHFQFWKMILIAILAASLASATLGIHGAMSIGIATVTCALLIFILLRHKITILNGFASIEARYYTPSQHDKNFWGIKPKYGNIAPYLPMLGAVLGPYSFVNAIHAAYGSTPINFEKFVSALFGLKGVVFAWEVIGIIICISTLEFSYYLLQRRKTISTSDGD